MNARQMEQLLALASKWDTEAAEEVGDLSPELTEHSREGLAAGILSGCAAELRDLLQGFAIARESSR
jgi:hypothetical protein